MGLDGLVEVLEVLAEYRVKQRRDGFDVLAFLGVLDKVLNLGLVVAFGQVLEQLVEELHLNVLDRLAPELVRDEAREVGVAGLEHGLAEEHDFAHEDLLHVATPLVDYSALDRVRDLADLLLVLGLQSLVLLDLFNSVVPLPADYVFALSAEESSTRHSLLDLFNGLEVDVASDFEVEWLLNCSQKVDDNCLCLSVGYDPLFDNAVH